MGNGIDREYLKLSRNIDLITVDLLKKYDSAYSSIGDKNIDKENNKHTRSKEITPKNIAKDMIDLLEQNGGIKPDNIYIDLCCKSGIFLMLIRDKLMDHPELIEKYPDKYDRMYYIMDNLIYGICPNNFTASIVRSDLYGNFSTVGNIKIAESITDVKNKLKEFGDMKFDVVVGNPPYNSGMDLDFVNLGFEMSNEFVCMITPAKWQTANSNRSAEKTGYEQFRHYIVPHMSDVVYYPDCLDIFGIQETSGITYFLVNKKETFENRCNVTNSSVLQPIVNSKEVRDITHKQSLWNIGNAIVEIIGKHENLVIKPVDYRLSYTVNYNTQLSKCTLTSGSWDDKSKCVRFDRIGKGGVTFDNNGNASPTGNAKILKGNAKSPSKTSIDIFTASTEDECKYFCSWFDSKFVRFLLLINISSLSFMKDDCFRFVPPPGKFDHIYTDEELYKAFNLPQKYIDVIEAVIKERK